MDTPDNDTFQLLLEGIKEMNRNLEAATFAINNMTMQLNSVGAAITVDSILPRANSPKQINTNGDVASIVTPDEEQQPQALGYINWDSIASSHEILKSQCLIKMHVIRQSLTNLINGSKTLNKKAASQQLSKTQQRGYDYDSTEDVDESETGYFNFSKIEKPIVDKELRFPMDAVYVNVNSPKVKEEIQFMNKINVLPTEGVIDRFLKIVESEMQTCDSFEKQYGLKWA